VHPCNQSVHRAARRSRHRLPLNTTRSKGESRMRFAVIGAGVIGTLHAETIAALPRAELTTVVDVRPEPARSLAARYGVVALTDLNEALGRPEVDAVAICTPSGHHADLGEAALA